MLALQALTSLAGCNAFDETRLPGIGRNADTLVPGRPAPSTEGPSIPRRSYALRGPVLDQTLDDAWRNSGLNLDGIITDDINAPQVECTSATGMVTLDGEDGIDNVMGATFFPLVTLAPAANSLEADVRRAMEEGLGTFIVTVDEYNGTANDPRVRVGIAISVAGTSAEPDDVAFSDSDAGQLMLEGTADPAPRPLWDGHDQWFVRDDGFLLGDFEEPFITDANAYVVNHRVVVRLPDRVSLLIQSGTVALDVRLSGATAVATVSEDLETVSDVIFGGRIATQDMVAIGESVGICAGTTTFDILSRAVDAQADLLTIREHAGPDAVCDAVSVGIRFEGGVATSRTPRVAASPPLPEFCL